MGSGTAATRCPCSGAMAVSAAHGARAPRDQDGRHLLPVPRSTRGGHVKNKAGVVSPQGGRRKCVRVRP